MKPAGDQAPAGGHGDGGASLVFWLLVAMALTVFAPCMILPAWREYQEADLAERMQHRDAEAAEQQIQRLEKQLEGVQNDPVVMARLARRELRCTLPGDQRVAVFPASERAALPLDRLRHDDMPAQTAGESLTRRPPPVVIARLARFIPKLNYDALCCESPTREILIAMSVALLAAAFIIFWPRHARARSG